jgi:hypothetical protein
MSTLKMNYVLHLAAILAGLIVLQALRYPDPDPGSEAMIPSMMGPALFMGSAFLALGLPVFFRLVFIHRNRHEKRISEKTFIRFEKNLIHMVMLAPYPALAGYYFQISTFHFTGSVLMGLYAVYYYFPSRKRMAMERRVFRVG